MLIMSKFVGPILHLSVVHFQGQIAEAESMFNMMKIDGLHPDVIAYTAMLHAYSAAGGYTLVYNFHRKFSEFTEKDLLQSNGRRLLHCFKKWR